MRLKQIALFMLLAFSATKATSQNKDSAAVINAAASFIKAFTSFDWPAFRDAFLPGASIFFPGWEQGRRKLGKTDIEAAWLEIFPGFVDSTKRFDLKIDPKDLMVQLYGETAVVTFHLGGGNSLSRRTLVFVKEGAGWKIVHLHASNISQPKAD